MTATNRKNESLEFTLEEFERLPQHLKLFVKFQEKFLLKEKEKEKSDDAD